MKIVQILIKSTARK